MGVSASFLTRWTTRASSGMHSCSAASSLFTWATFCVSLIHSCGDETLHRKPKEMPRGGCPLAKHPWDPGGLPLAGTPIPGEEKTLVVVSGIFARTPWCFLDLPFIIGLEAFLQNLHGHLHVLAQGIRLLRWSFSNSVVFASRLESCGQGYYSVGPSGLRKLQF